MRAGYDAMTRYLEFFAVTIRNKNNRAAYVTACSKFFKFCKTCSIEDLLDIKPLHVATHIELMGHEYAAPPIAVQSHSAKAWPRYAVPEYDPQNLLVLQWSSFLFCNAAAVLTDRANSAGNYVMSSQP